MKFGLKIAERI